MSKKQTIIKSLLAQRLLPLFFYGDADVSIRITKTLYNAGVRVLEYTNRGDNALKNFMTLKKLRDDQLPGMYIGIGTIKSTEEAEDFIAAGADFIVSPIINPEVAELANEHDIFHIPGCMTPSEIYTAQKHGAAIIKIFPANLLGPEFLTSIKDLFRGQLFIPTGGVELEQHNIDAWFNAGVCAVGIGSKLISKQVLDEQLYDQLHSDTLKALELVNAAKLNY
jgi:2-dehydro-3-deoxyphosphogluconate aldolase/(4S)-4-hydroxy-2-oxoglutarate aldolase